MNTFQNGQIFLSRISSSHLRLRVVCVSIRFQNECADRNFDRVKR